MTLLIKKIVPLSLAFSLLLLFAISPKLSSATVLAQDTVWKGSVEVSEDLLIPKGVVLTVKAGTIIKIVASESSKTDPEYFSPLTEITVRGTLNIEGTEDEPVELSSAENKTGSWGGIIVDKGNITLQSCQIKHADTAIHLISGDVKLRNTILKQNRYGVVAQSKTSSISLLNCRIYENEYGLFAFQNARINLIKSVVSGNKKRDSYTASFPEQLPTADSFVKTKIPVSRQYEDEVFRGDTIWQGRIEVAGVIRVPEGSRLIILPGTIVEFRKKDTTGNGLGENGIMIQGRLIAKGTAANPIFFRSAEKVRNIGDWDSINIMNSAGVQNLIEYCQIEDAYRGLHFHFSNVAIHHTKITNNYRGIQFQESQVLLKENQIYGNNSGVQGRDSDLKLIDNLITGNGIGANFFRTNLTVQGNRITSNGKEGIRIREGVTNLNHNLIDGNRFGLMVADMFYGDYSENVITNNMEVGMSVKNVDNIDIADNFIASNGLNGLNIQEVRANIKGNLISDNGERGIGIQSFDGEISHNNLAHNGLFAVDLETSQDVSAAENWWGGDDPSDVISDKRLDSSRGRVKYNKIASKPFRFRWLMPEIHSNIIWRGDIAVSKTVTVDKLAELKIVPDTVVEFSENSGLLIKGRLIAKGESAKKIRFTSELKKGAGDWDEIQLEYAIGSIVDNCIFEYATWGLHSHFTNLVVSNSTFSNNSGGMRFRSGPAEIRDSIFENNTIGIRAYIGNAIITGNSIRKNEVGIFVREKGGGLVISGNNIYENSSYGVRVGDFNTENVNAVGNWWNGDPNSAIFDDKDESGIGKVLFDPVLKKPEKIGMED